jgi:hypothetical protein
MTFGGGRRSVAEGGLPPVLGAPRHCASIADMIGWFDSVLIDSRSARNFVARPTELSVDRTSLEPAADGEVVVPHIVAGTDSQITLIWERLPSSYATAVLEAPISSISRWARRVDAIMKVAQLAAASADSGGQGHLSFRWILANEALAARLAASGTVDHVSLHFTEQESVKVAGLLEEGIGLLEITRPESIRTPGRWFVSSTAMIHLSTRPVETSVAGRGSTPNHVCLAVIDLDAALEYMNSVGIAFEYGGSLDTRQIWVRWPSGHTIEIQGL